MYCILTRAFLVIELTKAVLALTLNDFRRYSVSGVISLPDAGINEPFDAWYDTDQLASRIDYYSVSCLDSIFY